MPTSRARSRTHVQGLTSDRPRPQAHRGGGGRHRRPRDPGSVRKGNALVASFAVAAAPVVAAPVAMAARAKTVTLSVDGVAHEVSTPAETVEDVLESQDIQVDHHDRVTPTLGTPIDDGSRVAVQQGRRLTLDVDGEEETHWVHATTVGEALDEVGRPFPGAELSAFRTAPISQRGMELDVRTQKRIFLVQAGVKTNEVTTALTVGGALRDLGVPFDEGDEVTPSPDAAVRDGMRIRVIRLEEVIRRVREAIPNRTIVRYDDSMLEGETKVVRRGRDGVRVVEYEALLADGETRRRHKVDQTLKRKPVARIEVHGTMNPGPSNAACPLGSAVESGLTSNAVAVYRAVCAEYPSVDTYYGLRPGDSGEHGSGRALDIMVYSDSGTGNAIAEWVRAHASELGVSEVIWAQRIWTVQRSSEGWRWMEDRGSTTANHYDHVHVTVY